MSRREKPSLSRLYKNESIRQLIWDVLKEDFENSFESLLKDAKNVRSLLVKPAEENKSFIRELVIEYGFDFQTLNDLKECLDALKVWAKDECDCPNDSQVECDSLEK